MTYIDLLNSYWDSTRFDPCSSNEAMLYFYLLHQCNIRRWINPFEFKTRNLEIALGLSRKSIMALRNKLKQRGLIDYTKGIGSGCAAYKICGAEITNKSLYKTFCDQDEESKGNTKGNTMGNTMGNTNENYSLLSKEKRYKTIPPISPKGESVGARQESLFSEKETRYKSPKQPKEEPHEPTLEEVKEYFLKVNADVRFDDWEMEAQGFYDYFRALGWKNTKGTKIIHWDSKANSWITDHELKEKERTANGNPGNRRSGLSSKLPPPPGHGLIEPSTP